jgi:hypothetical protein
MRLRELLIENLDRTGESKSAVVGWGRGMGHKGHMMLASSVLTQANEAGADPYFVISRTMGKDDPLSPEEKLQIYNKVFPNNPEVFRTATEEMPDLNRVLKRLATMGYGDVTVVVGADQVNAFQYLVRPDKSGVEPYKQFGLDSMKVIARQETNDPSKDEEGPRATPMRQALVDPDMSDEEKFAVWRDAMSPELSDQEVRDLMGTALQRMQDFSKPKQRATKKKEVATAEERVELVKSMEWPDFINKLSSAMKATGWKGKRKSDDAFLFSVAGPDDDVWYMVIVENIGNGNFSYALGTVEEGDPYIDDEYKGQMPTTEASLSELIDMIRDGFGLNEEAAGVGIVTKQNTTADVGPGTLNKMLKAFKLK